MFINWFFFLKGIYDLVKFTITPGRTEEKKIRKRSRKKKNLLVNSLRWASHWWFVNDGDVMKTPCDLVIRRKHDDKIVFKPCFYFFFSLSAHSLLHTQFPNGRRSGLVRGEVGIPPFSHLSSVSLFFILLLLSFALPRRTHSSYLSFTRCAAGSPPDNNNAC